MNPFHDKDCLHGEAGAPFHACMLRTYCIQSGFSCTDDLGKPVCSTFQLSIQLAQITISNQTLPRACSHLDSDKSHVQPRESLNFLLLIGCCRTDGVACYLHSQSLIINKTEWCCHGLYLRMYGLLSHHSCVRSRFIVFGDSVGDTKASALKLYQRRNPRPRPTVVILVFHQPTVTAKILHLDIEVGH